jgi:hypothetical protein
MQMQAKQTKKKGADVAKGGGETTTASSVSTNALFFAPPDFVRTVPAAAPIALAALPTGGGDEDDGDDSNSNRDAKDIGLRAGSEQSIVPSATRFPETSSSRLALLANSSAEERHSEGHNNGGGGDQSGRNGGRIDPIGNSTGARSTAAPAAATAATGKAAEAAAKFRLDDNDNNNRKYAASSERRGHIPGTGTVQVSTECRHCLGGAETTAGAFAAATATCSCGETSEITVFVDLLLLVWEKTGHPHRRAGGELVCGGSACHLQKAGGGSGTVTHCDEKRASSSSTIERQCRGWGDGARDKKIKSIDKF